MPGLLSKDNDYCQPLTCFSRNRNRFAVNTATGFPTNLSKGLTDQEVYVPVSRPTEPELPLKWIKQLKNKQIKASNGSETWLSPFLQVEWFIICFYLLQSFSSFHQASGSRWSPVFQQSSENCHALDKTRLASLRQHWVSGGNLTLQEGCLNRGRLLPNGG